MTREEQEQYLDQELNGCLVYQKEQSKTEMRRLANYGIFQTDADFTKWVSATKQSYANQASPEEIGLVMSHMEGAGNNATKQLAADHALKKIETSEVINSLHF